MGSSRGWGPRRVLFFFIGKAATLLRDERGQGTVEYVLILSATVVGAAALARQIINALDNGILKMGATLERDLKTGRAPLDIWEN